MRKITTLLTAATMVFAAGQAIAAEKLSVYHWFEYIPQELLNKFTAETGIEVVMDTYDSNEAMLANLKAGGMGTYDVAVPSDYMVKIMRDEDMLGSFNSSELKNFGNIQDQWMNVDFDMGARIPYRISGVRPASWLTAVSFPVISGQQISSSTRLLNCAARSMCWIPQVKHWRWRQSTWVSLSAAPTSPS